MTATRAPQRGAGRRLACAGASVGVVCVAALLAWGDVSAWRASTSGFPAAPPQGGRRVVVVLGYGNAGTRPNLINRWRVRAGVRTLRREAGESILIVSGGPVKSETPEAQILATEARRQGYRGRIQQERASMSTAQNVALVAPLLRVDDRVSLVSDPVHAERARVLLVAERPELASRLVPGVDFRFGERPLVNAVAAMRARGASRRRN